MTALAVSAYRHSRRAGVTVPAMDTAVAEAIIADRVLFFTDGVVEGRSAFGKGDKAASLLPDHGYDLVGIVGHRLDSDVRVWLSRALRLGSSLREADPTTFAAPGE